LHSSPNLLRRSAGSPFCDPFLDQAPDQTPIAFCERELVCKASFQKYAYTVMASQVSCGNQHFILGHAKVCEMGQFRQYE
jgi:hypothetical protein